MSVRGDGLTTLYAAYVTSSATVGSLLSDNGATIQTHGLSVQAGDVHLAGRPRQYRCKLSTLLCQSVDRCVFEPYLKLLLGGGVKVNNGFLSVLTPGTATDAMSIMINSQTFLSTGLLLTGATASNAYSYVRILLVSESGVRRDDRRCDDALTCCY